MLSRAGSAGDATEDKMRSDSNETTTRKSNPPSALLIFPEGFEHPPIVFPNAGSEEADNYLTRWLQQKLSREDETP
jgi:hypothetical protein